MIDMDMVIPVLLPVTCDFIFKLIFGDQRNIDILAEFLKSVLDVPDSEYERITIVDPHVKKESKGDKYGILDVKVHTKSGTVINCEIQVEPIPEMKQRSVYFMSKMVTEQMASGLSHADIKRSIVIIITAYDFNPGNGYYHHQYRYRSNKDGTEFTDMTEFNALDLTKLPAFADNTELWYWMKFMSVKSKEELEMLAQRSPQMRKAVGVLKELSADERTRMIYEEREIARRDMVSRMGGAERKGHAEGRAEGLAEGRAEGLAEGRVDVIRNAIEMGMDIDTIIKLTCSTREEVEALR